MEVPAESQEAVLSVAPPPPDLHLGFHELSLAET